MEHRFCRPCARPVVARRPTRLAWIGLVATALGMLIAVLVASLIGPFIMFALPFMALFGFAIGPLVTLVVEPAACPRCHRELRYRHRDEIPAARLEAAPRRAA